MIDELRESIQRRLQELDVEAARLRAAPDALKSPGRRPAGSGQAYGPRRPGARSPRGDRRAVAGETRRVILAALAGGEAMTAGQLADRTGLRRGSISTLVSQLAQRGELLKAPRGYQLPRPAPDQAGTGQSGDRARLDTETSGPVQALRRELDAGLRP